MISKKETFNFAMNSQHNAYQRIIFFDTTLRDGELAQGVRMGVPEKVEIARLLEQVGVDVIEVGYPGYSEKDFDEIRQVAASVKQPIICGLAGSKEDEIVRVARALAAASRSRINVFTPVNLKQETNSTSYVLNLIEKSVSLARRYCDDVQWSAFDAPRGDPDFLCQAVDVAIASGATTITIPDSLGLCSPDTFSQLIQRVRDQIPDIDKITISVHCHDDLGYSVENSLVALKYGARQIECSINGLGARKGNANLAELVGEIRTTGDYELRINDSLLPVVAEVVARVTKRNKS